MLHHTFPAIEMLATGTAAHCFARGMIQTTLLKQWHLINPRAKQWAAVPVASISIAGNVWWNMMAALLVLVAWLLRKWNASLRARAGAFGPPWLLPDSCCVGWSLTIWDGRCHKFLHPFIRGLRESSFRN